MFWWGVSTAAYQIEGGTGDGGRGRSIWDTFAAEPGRISDGSTGDVACDHFHRYAEDIALMAELGVDAYRFSVAWPRIQPDGTGAANPAGLAFYDRLVDALLARGIAPVVTLFHWDLPQPLEDKGGWLERDTAHRFAEYADLVAGALGDRVALWITLNEPFVHMALGYAYGVHAPGRALMFDALPVAHHQLLGHGLAVAALRTHGPTPVAIANNYTPVRPYSKSEGDLAAADFYDRLHNRLFTDPLFGRSYPLDVPGVRDSDLDIIAAPLDALGVNYYMPTGIRAAAAGELLPFEQMPLEGYARTGFDWPVAPEGLHTLLTSLKEEYAGALPPIYVTESGCAYPDVVGPDGGCADPDRVSYLDSHVAAVRRAAADGVDVRGYFVWSLLDNWEWAEGFSQRFGLVHVDFATQTRTRKSSYAWYQDLIRRDRG
jgi:beta-glucosidase